MTTGKKDAENRRRQKLPHADNTPPAASGGGVLPRPMTELNLFFMDNRE